MTASALERQAAALADRGGVPWAVLKGQANINAQQAGEAQARWVAASARRDGAPAVLGNGWDLETLTLSPKDMALLEIREMAAREICAAFGVPAYLVNVEMTSGLTYANADSFRDQHWAATLRIIANLVSSSWSRWLLPRGTDIEVNPDRYVQPALAARMTTWSTAHAIVDPATGERVMSVDEIRAAERLAPLLRRRRPGHRRRPDVDGGKPVNEIHRRSFDAELELRDRRRPTHRRRPGRPHRRTGDDRRTGRHLPGTVPAGLHDAGPPADRTARPRQMDPPQPRTLRHARPPHRLRHVRRGTTRRRVRHVRAVRRRRARQGPLDVEGVSHRPQHRVQRRGTDRSPTTTSSLAARSISTASRRPRYPPTPGR